MRQCEACQYVVLDESDLCPKCGHEGFRSINEDDGKEIFRVSRPNIAGDFSEIFSPFLKLDKENKS